MSVETIRVLSQFSGAEVDFLSAFAGVSWTHGDVLYVDSNGDITRLAAGTDGQFLKTRGAGQNPEWGTPAGSGDVSKVGTPVDNQVAVWTGDGTIEGDTALTFDTATDTLTVGAGAGILVTHAVRADASDGLIIESNNGTDVGIFGAGNTANVTWYGSHNFDTATQDTLAAFTGAGKTLGSLALATYPSLTEISYVKGVTSGIQTQIDAKANSAGALTQFVGNGNWKLFYSDGSGDIQELALGADGTFLKSNGAALAPSFETPAGSGDVSKVGTPVDGQIGVWTGDGTIEGDAALTFDTTTDSLVIAASGNLLFGAVTVLDDNAGTMTLSNIDALDATTEATIESAIDTLANLISIQGLTVTLADAGADAIFGWDDSTSAYENLTQSEVLAVIGDAAADGSTKGVATFTAADFNAASGVISIDYTNAQKASTSQAGFVTALATTTEANTGTDTSKALTADSISSAIKSIMLTAAGGSPLTTAGCSDPTKVEAATNDINYYVLDFDATTEEHAFWSFCMPENWDGGTVNATFYWTNASGLTTETVVWGIAGGSWGDSDAIDAALGTEITVTDTWLAQGDLHISPESSAITIANAGPGEWVNIVVARKVASDNLTGDARLIAVKLTYTIDQYSDEI